MLWTGADKNKFYSSTVNIPLVGGNDPDTPFLYGAVALAALHLRLGANHFIIVLNDKGCFDVYKWLQGIHIHVGPSFGGSKLEGNEVKKLYKHLNMLEQAVPPVLAKYTPNDKIEDKTQILELVTNLSNLRGPNRHSYPTQIHGRWITRLGHV